MQETRKRRRVKTDRFEFDSLDNEEQKIIQQAIKNSLKDQKRVQLPVPPAPVYYPTVEEFEDPIAYINKIRSEAEKYGICKIIPPSEWQPICQINFSIDNTSYFPTKRQDITTLQEGNGFDDGKQYNFASYRQMADSFYDQWISQYYYDSTTTTTTTTTSSNSDITSSTTTNTTTTISNKDIINNSSNTIDMKKKISYTDLERDYWDIVETHRKQAIVEYGNDLDTEKYMSGFPIIPIVVETSYNKMMNNAKDMDSKNMNGCIDILADKVCHTNQSTSDINSQHTIIDIPTTTTTTTATSSISSIKCEDNFDNNNNNSNNSSTTTTIFDHNYYVNSGWNLTKLPHLSNSLLSHIKTSITGVNVPWLYIGMLFSSFCWHNEDNYLFSINYSHMGEGKQWYGVPASDAKLFEKISKNFLMESFKESPDLLHHMTTQISPSLLQNNGVLIYQTIQEARSFIVTFPKAYHCGFSYGFNCGEAVNFATLDWLIPGGEAEEKYREIARGSVFSHQRLLFTLLHHLDTNTMSPTYQKILASEILKIIDEEIGSRAYIINTLSIQDISKKVNLPSNDFYELSHKVLEFDDMRVCCICQHICIFTAVACECDHTRIVCIRHVNHLCKCKKERKFVLKWGDDQYLHDIKKKLRPLLSGEYISPMKTTLSHQPHYQQQQQQQNTVNILNNNTTNTTTTTTTMTAVTTCTTVISNTSSTVSLTMTKDFDETSNASFHENITIAVSE